MFPNDFERLERPATCSRKGPVRAALNTSFTLLRLLIIAMVITCIAAGYCSNHGWLVASMALSHDARSMLLAIAISLPLLMLIERLHKR